MIGESVTVCPICGEDLKYYDRVKRISIGKRSITNYIWIRRFRCVSCKSIHRELTDDVLPYIRYEAEIVRGVLEGFITPDTYGFEDYPCVMSMIRWFTKFNGFISNLE